jgi:sorting nexin-9/18/33
MFGQLRLARIGMPAQSVFCMLYLLNFFLAILTEMSKAERLLSYSLLSLITSKPLASASTTGISDEYEEQNINDKFKGTMNAEGAWCWKEGCKGQFSMDPDLLDNLYINLDCLKLTKAIQRTSETLQSVADLYDDHVSTSPYFVSQSEHRYY